MSTRPVLPFRLAHAHHLPEPRPLPRLLRLEIRVRVAIWRTRTWLERHPGGALVLLTAGAALGVLLAVAKLRGSW